MTYFYGKCVGTANAISIISEEKQRTTQLNWSWLDTELNRTYLDTGLTWTALLLASPFLGKTPDKGLVFFYAAIIYCMDLDFQFVFS